MNNGFYGHRVDCLCILCQETQRGIQQASQEQLNQLYALQMGAQYPEPAPGDVEHMKVVEPVDDEPVKQIEWTATDRSLWRKLRRFITGE